MFFRNKTLDIIYCLWDDLTDLNWKIDDMIAQLDEMQAKLTMLDQKLDAILAKPPKTDPADEAKAVAMSAALDAMLTKADSALNS